MTHTTPGHPPKDATRLALIIGIAVTAVLLVGVGITALVLALGGGDDDNDDDPTTSSQSAEDAMREFVQATNDGDCEVLVRHPITKLDSVEDCESELEDAQDEAEDEGYDFDSFTLEIDDLEVTSESDSKASIALDVTQSYELDGDEQTYEATFEYELEKEEDAWVVVSVDNDLVESPDTAPSDD